MPESAGQTSTTITEEVYEHLPTVHQSVAAVMRDIEAVGKDSVNEQQRFKYRGIDALVNALSPVMAKHGVVLIPTCTDLSQDERATKSGTSQVLATLTYRFRVYGPAGDYIEGITYGQGLDMSDKAINKAMTAGYKYAVAQTFCIPFAGQDDSDGTTIDRAAPAASHSETTTTTTTKTNSPTKAALHQQLSDVADSMGRDVEGLTAKWRQHNGDISLDEFLKLPADRIFPFVRQVKQYAETQAKS